MSYRAVIATFVLLVASVAALAQQASDSDFTVGDIKIEGLQRISEGTVFNYLPVNIGDQLNAQRLREALRALYATGFFRDVALNRDGNTLLITVLERPSLESVEIKGNKDIKTEDLQKSLRNVGLAAGKTFNRSTLEEVTQYLTDQYYSRGKYAVSIDAKVEDLSNNRVRVNIDIKEGDRAKIREINIVGNKAFKPKDILETLTLKTPTWSSFYKDDDRYSRESLQGDLEKIESYYQDRGYANVRIDSVQVAIAPDKNNMFITVNITEGAGLQDLRGKAGRQHGGARGAVAAPDSRAARPDLFAEDHFRDSGADQEPAGRGGFLLRQGGTGAAGGRQEAGSVAVVVHRSGQPRVRTQHFLQGRRAQQR